MRYKIGMTAPPIRAALFDLDGTLVRTFIDFPAMRRDVLALAERWGAADAVVGETDILEIVAKTAAAVGPDDGRRARAEAYALLEEREREGCARPEPVVGAADLLRRLRGEHRTPVAVITRNARAVAEELIAGQNLVCDVLIAREDTDEFKPHPAPLLRACEQLGVAPQHAAMTGDLWADMAAGRAAGAAFTVGIQWAHDPPGRFASCPPDYEVPSLEDAAGLLLGAAARGRR
jgi:phosphoglycolate phosphatase